MTVIAACRINKIPIIVGDLLVTASANTNPFPILPFSGENPYHTYIVGMRQKLYILNKNTVIGWSGSVINAQYVMSELKNEFENSTPSSNQIFNFINQIDPLSRNNVNFTGIVKTSTSYEYFIYSSENPQIPPDSYIEYIIGSGANDYIRSIAGNIMRDMPSSIDNAGQALAIALSDIANVTLQEIINQNPLNHFYGGAYELALPQSRYPDLAFSKFDDYCILFWEIKENAAGERSISSYLIVKPFYVDDILCIQRIITNGEEQPILYLVDSILPNDPLRSSRIVNSNENISRSLTSEIYINVILYTIEGQPTRIFKGIDFNSLDINFTFENGKHRVNIGDNFIQKIYNKIDNSN